MMMSLCVVTLMTASLLQSTGTPTTMPSAETFKKEHDFAALKKKAEAGDPKAQVQLGLAYASGDGVAEDDAESVKWFRLAAERGNAAGEYSLGEMYLTGRGVSADLTKAMNWMRRAAEHGDARGEFNLAVMYSQGQGWPLSLQSSSGFS
jgi:TPR repeat protein